MGMYIQDYGVMILLMVLEFIGNQVEQFMRVIGKMIFSMEKGKKNVILILIEGIDNSCYKGEYF